MELWLLRASAPLVDPASPRPSEHLALSAEGRRIVRALGQLVKTSEDPEVGAMLSSPHATSIQTAELFADRVDYVGVIDVLPALAGGVPPSVFVPPLLARSGIVILVAEEPVLSDVGAFVVSRPSFPQLQRAQVSVLRDREPAWCLRPGDLARQLLLLA